MVRIPQKGFNLTHRHVIQDIVLSAYVFFRSKTGKEFEVVNEMGLIVKAAILRNDGPVHFPALFDFSDCFLESDDFQIRLGGYADLLFEHVDKMLLRIADVPVQPRETNLIGLANDFAQSICDGGIGN